MMISSVYFLITNNEHRLTIYDFKYQFNHLITSKIGVR